MSKAKKTGVALGQWLGQQALWLFTATLLLVGSAQAATGTTTVYLHEDALGSVVGVSDESGELIWQGTYAPYGEPTADGEQSLSYTGHVYDMDSGLVYMGARYYDPQIGRFLARDPVGYRPSEPLSFNPYVYANNNPYMYVDPDGREPQTQHEQLAAMGLNSLSAPLQNAASQVSSLAGGGVDIADGLAQDYYSTVGIGGIAFAGIKGAKKLLGLGSAAAKGANFTRKQLDKKFKHASDFGIYSSKKNSETLAQFETAIKSHLGDSATVQKGTYGFLQDSKVYFNSSTNNAVILDESRNFVTGFKLSPGTKQFDNFMNNGVLR